MDWAFLGMRQTALICIAVAAAVGIAEAQARKTESPDQKELYNYVLTMDKIQKASNATKDLQEYAKKHPELGQGMDGDAKNLNDMVARLQKYPEAVAILNKDGISPREYAVCFMTLMQASMAVGFKKSGTYKDYPPKMLEVVSKPNLDFVDQHWDQIRKMTDFGGGQ